MIRDLFFVVVKAKCDEPCTGTQAAIDKMAAKNCQDRGRMLDWLSRCSTDALVDALMVAWPSVNLKLATGRSRDEWLDLINTEGRGGRS